MFMSAPAPAAGGGMIPKVIIVVVLIVGFIVWYTSSYGVSPFASGEEKAKAAAERKYKTLNSNTSNDTRVSTLTAIIAIKNLPATDKAKYEKELNELKAKIASGEAETAYEAIKPSAKTEEKIEAIKKILKTENLSEDDKKTYEDTLETLEVLFASETAEDEWGKHEDDEDIQDRIDALKEILEIENLSDEDKKKYQGLLQTEEDTKADMESTSLSAVASTYDVYAKDEKKFLETNKAWFGKFLQLPDAAYAFQNLSAPGADWAKSGLNGQHESPKTAASSLNWPTNVSQYVEIDPPTPDAIKKRYSGVTENIVEASAIWALIYWYNLFQIVPTAANGTTVTDSTPAFWCMANLQKKNPSRIWPGAGKAAVGGADFEDWAATVSNKEPSDPGHYEGKYDNPMLAAAIWCVIYPKQWAEACMAGVSDKSTTTAFDNQYLHMRNNGPPKAPWTVCKEKNLKWPGKGDASLENCIKLFGSETYVPIWKFLRQ